MLDFSDKSSDDARDINQGKAAWNVAEDDSDAVTHSDTDAQVHKADRKGSRAKAAAGKSRERDPETPEDADHVSTMASKFHVDVEVEEAKPVATPLTPPEFDDIDVLRPAEKYRTLMSKFPSPVEKYCQLPYKAPRGHDGSNRQNYRLLGSYQLISPGASAPTSLGLTGWTETLADAALRTFDCTLKGAETNDRIRTSLDDFREFLKERRDDPKLGEFVKTALRDDHKCDPGQLTPLGVAYHLELGESLANSLVERQRLFNAPFEEQVAEEAEAWLRSVREAAASAYRKRVVSRATKSQQTVVAALATMFAFVRRLRLPSSFVHVEVIDYEDRFCDALIYNFDDNGDGELEQYEIDCQCRTRDDYFEEADRQHDEQVRFPANREESKAFSTFRDVVTQMGVPPSKFDTAARIALSYACDKVQPGCVKFEKHRGDKDGAELCLSNEDLKAIVESSEFIEGKWARDRFTSTYSIMNAYPYFLGLIGRWTSDIASPDNNYKLLDTAQRLGSGKKKSSTKPREFVALQLDFADVRFLTDLRRLLNVSSIGQSTRWMGFGQRLIFELYESLGRAPGEVLVRIADPDRDLTQKSTQMCPKTYGTGLCQLSLIHDYASQNLLNDATGVSDYNRLCRPLKSIRYND